MTSTWSFDFLLEVRFHSIRDDTAFADQAAAEAAFLRAWQSADLSAMADGMKVRFNRQHRRVIDPVAENVSLMVHGRMDEFDMVLPPAIHLSWSGRVPHELRNSSHEAFDDVVHCVKRFLLSQPCARTIEHPAMGMYVDLVPLRADLTTAF